MPATIFVTGAAGFIGSRVTHILSELGYSPRDLAAGAREAFGRP